MTHSRGRRMNRWSFINDERLIRVAIVSLLFWIEWVPCSIAPAMTKVQGVVLYTPTAFVINHRKPFHRRKRLGKSTKLATNPFFWKLQLSAPNQLDPTSSTKNDPASRNNDTIKEEFYVTRSKSLQTMDEFFVSKTKSSKNIEKDTTNDSSRSNELVENLGKAALQMGSDFLVALRWGAANALTAALPDDQRQILLERMDPEPLLLREEDGSTSSKTEEEWVPQPNSVNEAVVAAMATKSQRNEQRWEKEKEQILQQAELAVQQRVANELAIQRQRWDDEQRRLPEAVAVHEETSESEGGKLSLDHDGMPHPVLGTALYDFGYKRLYLVSADVLATIPVWKKQRTYRHERAKSMSVDKMKSLHLGFPGVICIHEELDTGKLCIIDGQHRVGMMKILQEKQQQQGDSNVTIATGLGSVDLDHILVEVFTETESVSNGRLKASSTTADHAQELFTEINKAEPVKLVDMPGVATAKERKMISQSCAKLEEQYPVMFSSSQKCRPPNVNIDNLRDTIFASNILKRHSIQTSTQLYVWMIQQNKKMGEKYGKDSKLLGSLNEKVWNKAKTNEFYLGLDSSWLYN